jgi:RHS repeat-associated protein
VGRQKTKLQYVALLFRLWVDTLPSPLKLGASRLRCFRLRPDVCAKTFSHDYIARLKAGSEISVHKQLISQLLPSIETKLVFISERGLTSTQWTEYSEHTKRVQYSTVSTSTITAEAVMMDGPVLSQKDTAGVVTTFTRSHHPALWYITWDPTQNIATRPLAIQKDGTWYTYGWDLTKNICEVYRNNGTLGTSYTYSPYGQVSSTGDVEQPIQWSSEFNDIELGLVYYNYRHYNPVDGRWIGRDKVDVTNNLLDYTLNAPVKAYDELGFSITQVFSQLFTQNQPDCCEKCNKYLEKKRKYMRLKLLRFQKRL